MLRFNKLLVCILLSTLAGCSSLGPMQQFNGPVNTPSFEPIALATVNDGSTKVLFKEFGCLFNQDSYGDCGVFFITDNGVYLAEWDTMSYEYKLSFHLLRQQVSSVSERRYVRDFGFDSNLLVIKDIRGETISFDIKSTHAAKYELVRL